MPGEPRIDPWWPLGPPAPEAAARLICLPYAGGGASVFRPWRKAAAARLDVCPVQLPGREARIREPAHRHVAPLVDALAGVLGPRLLDPYALFGYSMGALIAFELVVRFAAEGRVLPRALFVAAATPPHRRRRDGLHLLPDDRFKEALRALNGTPDAVLEHDELMALVLPTLRADFALCETVPEGAREPVDVPMVAFGGDEDPSVPRAELEAWGELTRGRFEAVMYPAHHFFLDAHGDAMLRRILDDPRWTAADVSARK